MSQGNGVGQSKLNPEQQTLVRLRIAEFTKYADIQKELKEGCGVEISLSGIEKYMVGEENKLKILALREKLDKQLDLIPIANKGFRCREIEKDYKAVEKGKDYREMRQKLRQEARQEREGLKVAIEQSKTPDMAELVKDLTKDQVDQAIEKEEAKGDTGKQD